ncbi:aminopeptidase [Leptospira perolatii]|uniref:Aminopeptidase n=1 Tax=Leptospira perolatii TaxID=2023191 RepID=A0A2M9ZNN3_9LEPT|nr:aminopeptidase [Leptospira perolatii]PJZ68922.1 aminopeptidase [Leptospira perolatii]PJZ73677.1 aminopeptidase [Leptospira perolatii]
MQVNRTHSLRTSAKRRLGFFRGRSCKKTLTSIILALCYLNSQGCIPYLFHLGKEQAKILYDRRSFEEVRLDPNVSSKTKTKLKEVEKIRDFGIEKIALSPKGGFQSFVQLNREAIGWHVSACHPLRFESYTWWFPIVGSVPYKGYFSLEMTKEEEARLKEEGWDTRIRVTAGYSTLGWFEDPLFSSQLYENESELISLILHEMAHATVYFKGDTIFNESYASFVEEVGTESYLFSTGGKTSVELWKKEERDRNRYMFLLKSTAKKLESIYSKGGAEAEILEQKKSVILQFKKELMEEAKSWSGVNLKKLSEKDWNNEDFLGMLRYHSGSGYFHKRFEELGKDFGKFHEEMRKLSELSNEQRKELLDSASKAESSSL